MQELTLIQTPDFEWQDICTVARESYFTPTPDFHKHEYYEIILILSGDTKILLENQAEEGEKDYLLLTRPGTRHYTAGSQKRWFLLFSEEFITEVLPEWEAVQTAFGDHGKILPLTPEQRDLCKEFFLRIHNEPLPFRKRLLTLYLLSYIRDFAATERPPASTPAYIIEALSYIEKHYPEKITAEQLAQHLYIGRTTLMTNFKKYTGNTLVEYITLCRLKNATRLLLEGSTEQEAAELCGLGESTNLIRCFKRVYGTTPRQYLQSNQ